MTPKDYRIAFMRWQHHFPGKEGDQSIRGFLSDEITPVRFPGISKIRLARKALLLPLETVAEKLQISRSALSHLERNETDGAITLEVMAQVAQAMDCEFVYSIRPKSRNFFSQIIWQKILKEALKHSWVKRQSGPRKPLALAAIARDLINDPEFRRSQGWSRRKN